MKKFTVKVTFTDDSTVLASLYAENDNEAMKNVYSNEAFNSIIAGHTIKNIEIQEVSGFFNAISPDDFTLSQDKDSGLWCVTDKLTGCSVTFEHGRFNETSETNKDNINIPPEATTDEDVTRYAAEVAHRIGDYMSAFHYNIAVAPPITYSRAIGKQFSVMRESRGISREELADLLQLSSTRPIERIEEGWVSEMRFSRLMSVAKALGCTLQLVPDKFNEHIKNPKK